MSARAARRAGTSILLAILALVALQGWMIAATIDRPSEQWGVRGGEGIFALLIGIIGAIIAARRPDNRIAWICLVAGLVLAVRGAVAQYPLVAQAVDPPLAGADWAKWATTWSWLPAGLPLLVFLPLVFPNGQLLSARWRALVWLSIVGTAFLVGLYALSFRPIGSLEAVGDPTKVTAQLGPGVLVGFALVGAGMLLSAASLVLRYRGAAGEEREQIKWLAYVIALVALAFPLGLSPLFFGQALVVGASLLIPVAIGIAILRYRLYEIDIIINRTLVYGALSAMLAGVYTASITLSQRLFVAITGHPSDAAIVLTTLIVASTFTPLRTRLQSIVDRRIRPVSATDVTSSGSAAVSAMLEHSDERVRKIVREEIARASGAGQRSG